jgi:hypothetical protein
MPDGFVCSRAAAGTHLFFENKTDSATIDVTIASLDAPAPFAPEKAIWLEDEPPCQTERGASLVYEEFAKPSG